MLSLSKHRQAAPGAPFDEAQDAPGARMLATHNASVNPCLLFPRLLGLLYNDRD